jgi:hypothetical protein
MAWEPMDMGASRNDCLSCSSKDDSLVVAWLPGARVNTCIWAIAEMKLLLGSTPGRLHHDQHLVGGQPCRHPRPTLQRCRQRWTPVLYHPKGG